MTGATGVGVLVSGDVGSSPNPAVTNFPPSSVAPTFVVHFTNDAVVQQAHADAVTAYAALLSQGNGTVLPDNLGTVGPLGPGVYSFASGAPDLPASATLTLNGPGIFVFNVTTTLVANVLSRVVGTANPCNIYWRVGTSATLNGTNFWGTVIADASITVGDGASLQGRALAGTGPTGAVTMAGAGGNTIGGCSAPPVCPAITMSPPTVPDGTVGVAYAQTLTASGGTASYTFSVVTGTLPAGLSLTSGGVLSGTPMTAGSSTVTIRATDANGCFAEITYTIAVAAPACAVITIGPPALPNGTVGLAYTQTLTASGGSAAYTFTVVSGALPAGLSLTSGGVLSGTPTTIGASSVTIRATDANGCFAEITYAIAIAPAGCPVITIAPPTLPNGSVGFEYAETLTASGGVAPYTFSVVSGALLAGATLTSGGVLSGMPTTPGVFTTAIRATAANGCFAAISYTATIVASVPTLPRTFLLLLATGLTAIGFILLRRRSHAQ